MLKLIFSIHGIISKVPAVDIYMYIPTLLAAADENGPRNASPPHVYTYYHRKFLVYLLLVVVWRSQKCNIYGKLVVSKNIPFGIGHPVRDTRRGVPAVFEYGR